MELEKGEGVRRMAIVSKKKHRGIFEPDIYVAVKRKICMMEEGRA